MSETHEQEPEEYTPEQKEAMTKSMLEIITGEAKNNPRLKKWLHGVSLLLVAKQSEGEDMTMVFDVNGIRVCISLEEEQEDPEMLHFELKSPPRFETGRIQSTDRIIETFDIRKVGELVGRHMTGDWGVCDRYDRENNEAALANGIRIMSIYELDGHRIYVITEADRSLTTVMYADEY